MHSCIMWNSVFYKQGVALLFHFCTNSQELLEHVVSYSMRIWLCHGLGYSVFAHYFARAWQKVMWSNYNTGRVSPADSQNGVVQIQLLQNHVNYGCVSARNKTLPALAGLEQGSWFVYPPLLQDHQHAPWYRFGPWLLAVSQTIPWHGPKPGMVQEALVGSLGVASSFCWVRCSARRKTKCDIPPGLQAVEWSLVGTGTPGIPSGNSSCVLPKLSVTTLLEDLKPSSEHTCLIHAARV